MIQKIKKVLFGVNWSKEADELKSSEPSDTIKALAYSPEIKSCSTSEDICFDDWGWSGDNSWTDQRAICDGYEASSLVYLCVNIISSNVASIPLKAEVLINGEWMQASDSDLQRVLDNPNKHQDYGFFCETAISHLCLTGNFVIRKIDYKTRDGVSELWLMRPDRVNVVAHPTKYISHYEYTPPFVSGYGQKIITYKPEDIIHHMLVDPSNPLWGWSPLRSGSLAIEGERSSQEQYNAMTEQRAAPSGYITTDCALDEDAYNNLRKVVTRDIEGVKNNGKVLVLHNGMKFSKISMSPEEVQYLETRGFRRYEILSLYGVPGPVAGFYENATMNNFDTAYKIFFQTRIVPLVNRVAKLMTDVVASKYDGDWRVTPCFDSVPALIPAALDRIKLQSEKIKLQKLKLDLASDLKQFGLPESEYQHLLESTKKPINKKAKSLRLVKGEK